MKRHREEHPKSKYRRLIVLFLNTKVMVYQIQGSGEEHLISPSFDFE